MNTQLLAPAAGLGRRLENEGPKALVDLAGRPMLVRTLERFGPLGLLRGAVIVVPKGNRGPFAAALAEAFPEEDLTLVEGGDVRQESVANGLDALAADTEIVVIHDAARPFVAVDSVQASICAAEEYGAASVAIPCVDTVFRADRDGFLVETPDRSALWACQTPQTFRIEVIREAHDQARRDGCIATDDATLVRRTGHAVKLVMGTPLNIKVTTPTDLHMASFIIEEGLVPCA